MNELAMQHIPESKYCFAINSNTMAIRLRVSKEDFPDKIEVVYGGKYEYAKTQYSVTMERSYEDRLFAWYTAYITLDDVRFVYIFKITEEGKVSYFSEDGLTDKFDFVLSFYNCFQLAYINEADVMEPVEWMKTAVFYQIFVERFFMGDEGKSKTYINMKWGELPTPKSFAGGDLEGIIQKLDYLKELGVNALYLTPIFQSVSNHKYDISDYYKIDEHFGDKETFRRLVEGAHSRGIKVVLDAVFNHCSKEIAQFQDVIKNGKNSQYFDWFVVHGDKVDCKNVNYECFASCAYMPKWNTSNKAVQDYLVGIATYWIKEYNIDGWRLDVSDEISHEFWRDFRRAVKAVKPDCVLIGENWHDANAYLHGDQYDSIMNYAFTKACLDFYCFGNFNTKQFADKLNEILMRNTDAVNIMMLNLLDSHDTYRFITEAKNRDKLKSALALLFMFVGVPCIYYGTEIALEGNFDPDSRRCMEWDRVGKERDVSTLVNGLAKIKTGGGFSDANIKITESDGLITVERNNYKLSFNGKMPVEYKSKNVILSNNYSGGELKENAFVLEKLN